MKEQVQRQSVENLPDRDRSRIEIRDQVRESLSRSTSGQELREDLAKYNIAMIVNRDQAGQPRGISFEQVKADQNGEEIRAAFKGSKLHQNLGMSQIQQQLTLNAQLRQKHAIEFDRQKERAKAQEVEKSRQSKINYSNAAMAAVCKMDESQLISELLVKLTKDVAALKTRVDKLPTQAPTDY